MAAAAGSGTPREEEGPSGEAAAPQPQAPTSAPGARLSRLPLARVKALVKADPDVTLAGQEAIFILARAAVRRERQGPPAWRGGEELFVETIAKDAYCCAQQGKRKTLQRRDLGRLSNSDNAIEAVDEFAFLEERERETERQRHRQREKWAPCREPDAGLHPGSPGSDPGLKVALNRCATGGCSGKQTLN
eukprot:XP_022260480.1 DNA polymerase epsilon subunit 4 isoform X1 [Canis lupus familiaris]